MKFKGDFWKTFTCFNCIMVSVKSVTNCSSYWLTLTPAISVRHFKETFRNMGTFKNCWGKKKNKRALQKCCIAFLQFVFKFKELSLFCKSTLYISVLINLVSNIYPRGIQFRNRSKVSKVAWTKGAFWEFSCKWPFRVYDTIRHKGGNFENYHERNVTHHHKLTQLKYLREFIAHAVKRKLIKK